MMPATAAITAPITPAFPVASSDDHVPGRAGNGARLAGATGTSTWPLNIAQKAPALAGLSIGETLNVDRRAAATVSVMRGLTS